MLLLVLILGMDQLQGIDLTLDLLLGLLLALLMAYMVFGWLTLSVRRVTLTNVRIRLSITTLRIWISTEATSSSSSGDGYSGSATSLLE